MPARDLFNLSGFTVAEKYSVEAIIGESGYALVYRATHIASKRPVAMQVFKVLGEYNSDARERLLQAFIQEGTRLAELAAATPAIRAARDIGPLTTRDGKWVPYMVFEWLEGRSLNSVLEHERTSGMPPRTLDAAIGLLEPAVLALELAHAQGLAHHDVKPSNLFIMGDPRSPNAQIKLLDFGTANVVSRALTMPGAFSPTVDDQPISITPSYFAPAYAAPEQFSGGEPTSGPWTDVFALALVVMEMITGKVPLEGDLATVAAGKRPTPRGRGAQVSDAVEGVFQHALAVDPRQRFQTAAQFWNALRAALGMPAVHPVALASASGPLSMRGLTHQGVGHSPPPPPPGSIPAAPPTGVAQPQDSWPTSTSAYNTSPPSAMPPRTPRWPIFAAAAGVGLVLAVGVGVVLRHGGGETSGPAGTSSVASAAAAPPPATCPDEMLKIPGGKFFMGSDEKDALDFEKPSHNVTLSPFCIDRFEVTTQDFKTCSDAGECKRGSISNDWPGITDRQRKTYDPLCNLRDADSRAKHPINCVDWEMADIYCKAKKKRLPTEAEWEFAARGPDGRKYPWGDDPPSGKFLNACGRECLAWGKRNAVTDLIGMYPDDDGWPTTAPVGSFPKGASRYGVEDVDGNVWEWVSDWYAAYTSEPAFDPTGPPEGEAHVIRGGAWNGGYPSWVRPTFRFRAPPTQLSHGFGFRCAKIFGSPPPPH
jgi:formylglycine-generating enzyme required for sulfatase activity